MFLQRELLRALNAQRSETYSIFSRHFHWLKLDTFSPRLNYSCAFYIFAAFFMHSSPSSWYFVFCAGAPHTPNIHTFFIYIMLEVQHKKSRNICHVECAARAVIFQLSKHLFPREFLWFFYHSFHSRLMSDANRINWTKKTKISSSGRKMRGKFIRERRLIKK